jgi:hypothetical protein
MDWGHMQFFNFATLIFAISGSSGTKFCLVLNVPILLMDLRLE